MSRLILPVLTLLWVMSCEWRPAEIDIDGSITIKNVSIVIGDTVLVSVSGSNFSVIEGQDPSIAQISTTHSNATDYRVELIGVNPGKLTLHFTYELPLEADSEVVSASYTIHLRVTESIPLLVRVGETQTVDFGAELSLDELNALDSVAVILPSDGSEDNVRVAKDLTQLSIVQLTGQRPGLTTIIFECYDSNQQLIASLAYEISTSIRKTVLAELYTNSGCINCPEANHYLDNLLLAYDGDLVTVRYHVNWTDPFDPMNLYNPGDVETRRAYYNIFLVPSLVLDGNEVTTLNEDDWFARVLTASQIEAPLYISNVDLVESVDSLHLEYDVNTFGNSLTDLTVWSIVYEDSIEYEGTNGEVLHNQVMRDMQATSIPAMTDLMQIQHSLKKPVDYGVLGPMGILVFVQSESDKAILQSRNQIIY